MRKRRGGVAPAQDSREVEEAGAFIKQRRMSWAVLIRKVYEVDPLRCPECGGEMKVISFSDKCQPAVVEKILRHGGVWKKAVLRPPPAVSRVADGESSYDHGYFERVRF